MSKYKSFLPLGSLLSVFLHTHIYIYIYIYIYIFDQGKEVGSKGRR